MGRPSALQIAEAIIHSARSGESDAEFDARLAGLYRLSDAELAAMGIFPRSSHRAQPSDCAAIGRQREEMARAGTGRPSRPSQRAVRMAAMPGAWWNGRCRP